MSLCPSSLLIHPQPVSETVLTETSSSHDVQNEEIPVTKNHLECYSANELVIIMNPIQVWFDTYNKAAKKSTSLFFADPSSKTSSRISFLENVYHRREQQCSPFCPLHLIKLTPHHHKQNNTRFKRTAIGTTHSSTCLMAPRVKRTTVAWTSQSLPNTAKNTKYLLFNCEKCTRLLVEYTLNPI